MTSKPISKFRFPALKSVSTGRYTRGNGVATGNIISDEHVDYEKLAQETYEILLADPRWGIKKEAILNRDDYKCVICGHRSGLQVHLRQYHYRADLKRFLAPWEYADDLLISLCEPCHAEGHRQYEVPVIHINIK
jgi:5-methylcytosine-specific restriction endonuclease McrA